MPSANSGMLSLSAASAPSAINLVFTYYLPIIRKAPPITLVYGKKAIGDPWQNWENRIVGANLGVLSYNWSYDWRMDYIPGRADTGQYARMVWCTNTSDTDKNGVTRTIEQAATEDLIRGYRNRVWLVLNEPDEWEQCGRSPVGAKTVQADPRATADHYVTVYNKIKSNDPYAKVFVGGLLRLNAPQTQNWWTQFVDQVKSKGSPLKMDGVHIHVYPGFSDSTSWPPQPTGRVLFQCLSQGCIQTQTNSAIQVGTDPNLSQVYNDVMLPLQNWFANRHPIYPNPGFTAIVWFTTIRFDQGANWPCKVSRTDLLTAYGETGGSTLLGNYWNSYSP